MTVKIAAERLNVSIATMYALCAHRQIRFSRVGLRRGKIVISEDAIAEYLQAREVAPERPEVPRAMVREGNGFTAYYQKVMAEVAEKRR
jgi:excisionase family DNA binding protein